jgi:hypothetical protein
MTYLRMAIEIKEGSSRNAHQTRSLRYPQLPKKGARTESRRERTTDVFMETRRSRGNRLDENGLVFSSLLRITLIRLKGLNGMGTEGGFGDGVE